MTDPRAQAGRCPARGPDEGHTFELTGRNEWAEGIWHCSACGVDADAVYWPGTLIPREEPAHVEH